MINTLSHIKANNAVISGRGRPIIRLVFHNKVNNSRYTVFRLPLLL